MATGDTRKVLTVLGFVILTVATPLGAYFLTKTVLDTREQAAEDNTLTVCTAEGDGCDFVGGNGIQQAVDAAQDGDTVLIKAGTYTRSNYSEAVGEVGGETWYLKAFVNIKEKQISLLGEDGAVLDGENSSPMVGIAKTGGESAIISNISISGFKEDTDCDETIDFCSTGTGILVFPGNTLDIEDCTVNGNYQGISVKGSSTIKKNTIKQNIKSNVLVREDPMVLIAGNLIAGSLKSPGLVIYDNSSVTIRNNIIRGNCDEGINLEDGGKITIINNIISKNSGEGGRPGGISIYRSPNVTIKNNIITENFDKGIYRDTGDEVAHSGTLTLDYNDVWHNYINTEELNYVGAEPGEHDISTDPLFISDTDFHLRASSPAINTGDPSLTDPNGTRSNMGAYGGPDACDLDPDLDGCSSVTCTPDCTGKECGDDGCGDSCGTCLEGATCSDDGTCELDCVPACSGRECGDDGCGGSCGTCLEEETCSVIGQCVETGECTPDCTGKECGDNGCGGFCGVCLPGETCDTDGQCAGEEAVYTPPVTTPSLPTSEDTSLGTSPSAESPVITTGTAPTVGTEMTTLPNTGVLDDWWEVIAGPILMIGGLGLYFTSTIRRSPSRVILRKDLEQ